MRRTGADIKSWTENQSGAKQRRPARIFLVGVRGRPLAAGAMCKQKAPAALAPSLLKHARRTNTTGRHGAARLPRLVPRRAALQGERRSMAQAIYVVTAAVDRYKELCEGKYTGGSVTSCAPHHASS